MFSIQLQLLHDLLEQPLPGGYAQAELLAEGVYDLLRVVAFEDLDLLGVSAVKLDLEDADGDVWVWAHVDAWLP